MDWTYLISLLSGGAIVSLFTIPSAIRRTRGEARSIDLDNLQRAVDGWRSLSEERRTELDTLRGENLSLNQKIDELYADISALRDRLASEQLINNQLRIEAAKNEIKICQKRNCQDRTPPTGY